jgi:DNA-binding response OmpR family regulator
VVLRVLLVCRDAALTEALRRNLEGAGILVEALASPEGVVADLAGDVVIFNLYSSARDLPVLQRWRRRGVTSPVLLLTDARDGLEVRVRGLDLGADDCLERPFEPAELLARLRALTRRRTAEEQPVLRAHDLEIDVSARTVRRGGRFISLTPREFDLLQFLATHRGRVVSRSMIWQHLYADDDAGQSNVIDVYIRYLRKKIDKGFETPLILTRWGLGYLLRGDSAEPTAANGQRRARRNSSEKKSEPAERRAPAVVNC